VSPVRLRSGFPNAVSPRGHAADRASQVEHDRVRARRRALERVLGDGIDEIVC
jgi:hypothetical protein